MAKHNLSRLDRQACPCQDTLEFGLAEPLVEVRERLEYEQEYERRQSDRQGEFPSMGGGGPSVPTTEDGTEITFENFPDANLVCPACGQEWIAVVDVFRSDESGRHPGLTEEDRERIVEALDAHMALAGKDWEDTREKLLDESGESDPGS